MDGYRREKVEEEPMIEQQIPIKNLPKDFIWMQVKPSNKMRNLMEYAYNNFPQAKTIIWTGYGEALTKAISCAEILKRKYKNTLYQITKIQYRKVTEHWVSLKGLEKKFVTKRLPMIHICLSFNPIGPPEFEFQKPQDIKPCLPVFAAADSTTNLDLNNQSGPPTKKMKTN